MKFLKSIAFLLIIFSQNAYSFQKRLNAILRQFFPPELNANAKNSPAQHPQRALLMFLDWSEKYFEGAVSKEFFTALEQKAGPILVSSYLFDAFLQSCAQLDEMIDEGKMEDTLQFQQHISQYVRIATAYNKTLNPEDVINRFKSVNLKEITPSWKAVLANRSFNPHDWIILHTDGFFLLIPHEIYFAHANGNKNVHRSAFDLGIHIDHMQQIAATDITNQVHKYQIDSSKKPDVMNTLSKIFIPRSEYFRKGIASMIPQWTIFIFGHGNIGTTIAAIPLPEFPPILSFFEEKVTTKLLIYNSCYGAGLNTQTVYKDLTRIGSSKTYSYPIITGALTDTSIARVVPVFSFQVKNRSFLKTTDIDWATGKLNVTFSADFKTFLKEALSQHTPPNYLRIIIPIMPFAGESLHRNFPSGAQIRLPGLPWFSVVDAKNRVISIGAVMAATSRSKPLDVMKFYLQQREMNTEKIVEQVRKKQAKIKIEHTMRTTYQESPSAILLYTSAVPFVLEMDKIPNELPQIISMIPGPAIHHLAGIYAPQESIKSVIDLFFHEMSPTAQKFFMVDSITATDTNNALRKLVAKRSGTAINITENKPLQLNGLLIIGGDMALFEYQGLAYGLRGEMDSLLNFLFNPREYQEIPVEVYHDILENYKKATSQFENIPANEFTSLTPAQLRSTTEKLEKIYKKRAPQITKAKTPLIKSKM